MRDDQLTILPVDDNMEFKKRICEPINDKPGFGTIKNGHGLRRRGKIFKHEKPYIKLLDIQLPGKNGIELLKYIRQQLEGFGACR
jgi:response regulator of citrate/malate metabolism